MAERSSGQMEVRDSAELAARILGSGLTQVKLAEAAECTKQNISKLATGKSKRCSVQIAHAIESSLQVVAGTLFLTPAFPVQKETVNSQESRTSEAAA